MAMNAICYICNQESAEWCRNFTEITCEHTQTPIADYIRQFLGDFHSTRNIEDEFNHICAECLQQIDDYDWMKQQANEQEAKLCILLLKTEAKFSENNEPNAEEYYENIGEDGCTVDEFVDMINSSEIELEPNYDDIDMFGQQAAPASPLPQSPPQTPMLDSILNYVSNSIPAQQTDHERKIVKVRKPRPAIIAYNVNTANGKKHLDDIPVSTTTTNSQEITSPLDSIPSLTNYLPLFTYAQLIFIALKCSRTGYLLTTEIFSFISEHFPYCRVTTTNWKRSVRSTLSYKDWFVNVDYSKMDDRGTNKCIRGLWTRNPSKISEIDEEIESLLRFQPIYFKRGMADPDKLLAMLRGEIKYGAFYRVPNQINGSKDSAINGEENETIDEQGRSKFVESDMQSKKKRAIVKIT